MSTVAAFLIVSCLSSAPIDDTAPEAVDVYRCAFDEQSDLNWDNWPDHWVRQKGKGYPPYVTIAMEAEEEKQPPSADRHLSLHLDGGAAAIYSPPIEVSASYSYILSCRVKTEKLTGHAAYVSLTTLDDKKQIRQKLDSKLLRGDQPWQDITIGPWATADADIRYVVIGLHAAPDHPAALYGSAMFDDLRFARLPRIMLEGDGKFNLYSDVAEPVITCRVSGIRQSQAAVQFELYNELAQWQSGETVPLVLQAMPAAAAASGQTGDDRPVYSGLATWKPLLPRAGFYRVSAVVATEAGASLKREISLAVVGPAPPVQAPGIFGWTIPQGEEYLSLRHWAQLAPLAGLNWIKFPVWSSDSDPELADRIAWFAERMGLLGIEFVGLFSAPPADQARELLGETGPMGAAVIFRDPEVWQQLVNPVMTRLSLKVRWWQLGLDRDASYGGSSKLTSKIAPIREHFERFGQDTNLTLAWNWLDEKPEVARPPWANLISFAEPQLTPRDLSEYLRHEAKAGRSPWIVLEPLRASEYDLPTRIRDLVLRMIVAKRDGATAAFIPDPFDPQTGLLHPDGTPGELFLPWRTTATQLAGTRYLGTIQFPNGSQNCVLERDGRALIVVWADRPTSEKLFLGAPAQLRQVDVWGREERPQTIVEDGHPQHVIQVGRMPTFLVGADLAIAKIRVEFAFDKQELSSSFGQEHVATMRFHNHFSQGVSGQLSLHAPNEWSIQPERLPFKAAADEEQVHSFRVFLRSNASSGAQPVRVDFDVRADQNYRFSVYRTVRVGLEDVTFELFATQNDDGNLLIEQLLLNKKDQPVSFNCLLFIPGRPTERRQVLYAPRGRRSELYELRNGAELAGKTLWMRAEEIGGGRILNYQINISP